MTLVFRANPFPYKLDLTLSCLLDDTAPANSPLFYISFSFTQSFLSYLLGNSVSPTLHSMHISQLPLISLLAYTARFLFVYTHCLQPPFLIPLLNPSQFSFCSHHSTKTVLIKVIGGLHRTKSNEFLPPWKTSFFGFLPKLLLVPFQPHWPLSSLLCRLISKYRSASGLGFYFFLHTPSLGDLQL